MAKKQVLVLSVKPPCQKHVKSFFRKLEETEALVKLSGTFDNCTSAAMLKGIEFSLPLLEHHEAFQIDETEEFDKSSPIINIQLSFTPDEIKEIKDGFAQLHKHLEVTLNPKIDPSFQLLEFLLDFINDREDDFLKFLGLKPLENVSGNCLICFDYAQIRYCDIVVCLKCKFFFQEIMRKREILSLRCSKAGKCISRNQIDISCRKCRFDRCRLANMVEQYCFTELPVRSFLHTSYFVPNAH